MRRGRPSIIGARILRLAQLYPTVAELSDKSGYSKDTVRSTLRRAGDRGDVHIKRVTIGKSGQAMLIRKSY